MSQPWWYSGEESDAAAEDNKATPAGEMPGEESSAPSVDWMSLLAGAQKVVDWATDRVLAPHSEHLDPNEHPDCMVCRATLVAGRFDIGIPRSWPVQSSASSQPSDRHDERSADADVDSGADVENADAIAWIPIVDEDSGARS